MQSTELPGSPLVYTANEKYAVAAQEPDALRRILSKITYSGDCWIWGGANNGRGYGVMTCNKQAVYVHRLSHWIVKGPIRDGFVLDHLCETPACVNPMHTEAVLQIVNTQRGKRASVTHCPQGHEYSKENTRIQTDRRGYPHRTCRTCSNARAKAFRMR